MPREDVTMENVVSTNIAQLGYDQEDKVLYITFNSGHEWAYEGVPEDVYENLRDAGSVGGYFARAVKGRFTGREV